MIEPFSMMINRLMDDHRDGITTITWAVYNVLSRFCNEEGKTHVSVRKMEEITQLTRPTIVKHLKILEYYGYIETQREGNGKSNSYKFDSHPKTYFSKKKKNNSQILEVPIFEDWDGGFEKK